MTINQNEKEQMSDVVDALMNITAKLSSIEAKFHGHLIESKRIEQKIIDNEIRIRSIENKLSRGAGVIMTMERVGWKALTVSVSLIISVGWVLAWFIDGVLRYYLENGGAH